MSALGAVSGDGIYAELEHNGVRFQVGQWTNGAMDAVSLAAYRKAKRVADDPAEKAVLSRMYALGEFNFEAVVGDGGLDRDPELLATFLFHLLKPHNPNISFALASELARDAKEAVIAAVSDANPRKERPTEPARTAPDRPVK